MIARFIRNIKTKVIDKLISIFSKFLREICVLAGENARANDERTTGAIDFALIVVRSGELKASLIEFAVGKKPVVAGHKILICYGFVVAEFFRRYRSAANIADPQIVCMFSIESV